jgi:H+/Cl- antiporter ClcA
MDMNQVTQTASPVKASETPEVEAVLEPGILHIIIIALASIIFTVVWLLVYETLNVIIWENNLVVSNRWLLPVCVMFFSLLVGLAQLYLSAPTVIHSGALETLKGQDGGDQKPLVRIPFAGTLISSICSLLSGASLGPEGALTFLIMQITTWMNRRFKLPASAAPGVQMAGVASAFNGIVGSPLFTGVLASDMHFGWNVPKYLVWNLLAGVIGYLVFTLLGLQTFAQLIPFIPVTALRPEYVILAIILGVLGAMVAVATVFLFQAFHKVISGAFKDRAIPRILAAGVIISITGYFVLEVLFSGEEQIASILANPAQYGVLALVFMGVLKLALLALAFKSGFLGGPTFPVLFACTVFGLALSLLLPSVPISIFVLCIEVAAITLLLRAPLTAILLVAVLGTATPSTVALLVISSVSAMLVGGAFMRLITRRGAQATPQPATAPA